MVQILCCLLVVWGDKICRVSKRQVQIQVRVECEKCSNRLRGNHNIQGRIQRKGDLWIGVWRIYEFSLGKQAVKDRGYFNPHSRWWVLEDMIWICACYVCLGSETEKFWGFPLHFFLLVSERSRRHNVLQEPRHVKAWWWMGEIHQCWLRNSSMRLKFKNFNKSNLKLGIEKWTQGTGFWLQAAHGSLTWQGDVLFPGAWLAMTPEKFQSQIPFSWLMWSCVSFITQNQGGALIWGNALCSSLAQVLSKQDWLGLASREVVFKQPHMSPPPGPSYNMGGCVVSGSWSWAEPDWCCF